MKKDISDEQLDHLMRTLISDASLTDADIDRIADSPAVWWAVKRDIENGKAAAASPWPPANWVRRALTFGVPAMAAAALLVSVFVWRANDQTAQDVAHVEQSSPYIAQPVDVKETKETETPVQSNTAKPMLPVRTVATRVSANRSSQAARKTGSMQLPSEVKTEFIALSYARNPDSGQIVRVKVPSSMMVTLGLVQTVDKPTNLVDAEVLVGDDGLTRAIRFIR